ncbi:MAG: NRDE family protein [Burkholderiales bacterium]
MCLILLASGAHPRFPLIVAANRDEAYARPSASAHFWRDRPDVFAGRDLEQGGTWLGIARSGRFAALTNYRQGLPRNPAARSRGELTRDFLIGSDPANAYVKRVTERGAEYNGFSLIAGEPSELYFCSNRGAAPQRIDAGVHGLSNHLLDEPWPKVVRGIDVLKSLLDADERAIVESLTLLLADREPAPDALLPSTGVERDRERALSAAFIAGEAYGTRASTIVLVAADGNVLFRESLYGPSGTPLSTHEEHFTIERALQCPAV